MRMTASTCDSRIVWLSTPTPTAGRFSASEFLRTSLQNEATLPPPPPPPPLLQAPRPTTPTARRRAGTTVRTEIRIEIFCRMSGPRVVQARLQDSMHAHRQDGD